MKLWTICSLLPAIILSDALSLDNLGTDAELIPRAESGRSPIDTYPINQCPLQAQLFNPMFTSVPRDWKNFRGSSCNNNYPLGLWAIACSPSATDEVQTANWFQGGCIGNESCIDGIPKNGQPQTALCVSIIDNGVSPAIITATEVNSPQRINVQAVPPNPDLEVLLTYSNNKTELYTASTIAVAPRDANNNTLGEVMSCQNCTNLGYAGFPAGTANFDLNFTISFDGDSVAVYAFGMN